MRGLLLTSVKRFLLILLLLVGSKVSFGLTASSASFQLYNGSFDSGGGLSSSASFNLNGRLGNSISGLSSSSSFTILAGDGPQIFTVGEPSATTGAARSITATEATLAGQISSNGASTAVTFDYGLTTSYGNSVNAAESPLSPSASLASVSGAVTGLTCNTIYHFRVRAYNGLIVNGSDSIFTTSACTPIPVDCVVSSWSAYGACSASCGGGTKTQTRTIVTPASNGGAACPALSQSQSCNLQTCQTSAPISTPGGTVNASITGGSLITTQATTPTNPPAGQSFPYGVFGFTAATNTLGGSITMTLTYPQALAAGTKVWKELNGAWLDWTSNVTFNQNRTTITYSITDGGIGDSDGVVNQSVTDPIGPGVQVTQDPSPAPIPTLSEWAKIMMMFLMILTVGWYGRRLKQR